MLAISGILFVFAGLTGAAVWHDGKVTAYLKTTRLRFFALVLGFGLVGSAFYLELSKQQESLTAEEVKKLLKPIEESIESQRNSLREIETENGGQNKAIDTLFAEVRSIDASVTEAYSDQHSNLLRIGQLLARHDNSLGCKKPESDYQSSVQSMTSPDLCDQVSALRFAVAIHIDKGIDRESLKQQFIKLGQRAYLTSDPDSQSKITDEDLAIVIPEGTPKELVCMVHSQFQERVTSDGNAPRVIRYLMSTATLKQITEPQAQSRYAIGLGRRVPTAVQRVRPMDRQSWQSICAPKYDQEGFEQFIAERLISP